MLQLEVVAIHVYTYMKVKRPTGLPFCQQEHDGQALCSLLINGKQMSPPVWPSPSGIVAFNCPLVLLSSPSLAPSPFPFPPSPLLRSSCSVSLSVSTSSQTISASSVPSVPQVIPEGIGLSGKERRGRKACACVDYSQLAPHHPSRLARLCPGHSLSFPPIFGEQNRGCSVAERYLEVQLWLLLLDQSAILRADC